MAQDLAGGIQVVRVIDPTNMVEGRPAKMLWAAAVARDKAVDAVLAAVPQGCAAELTDQHLPPDHVARLKLRPGDVRKLI